MASDDTACFEELLAQQREAYVELELRGAFGRLIDFVQRIEARMSEAAGDASDAADRVRASAGAEKPLAEELAREFHASWKGAIGTIADGVQRNVENSHNNTELLKQVLTQLLLYYTRFQVFPALCACALLTRNR